MKKFYFSAFIATVFLLGCTSDGEFDGDPDNIIWKQMYCRYGNNECRPMTKIECDASKGTLYKSCDTYDMPPSSIPDTPSEPPPIIPPPINVICDFGGGVCHSDTSRDFCINNGGNIVSQCPIISSDSYCYDSNWGNCNLIGPSDSCYMKSEFECISFDGMVMTISDCNDQAATINGCYY